MRGTQHVDFSFYSKPFFWFICACVFVYMYIATGGGGGGAGGAVPRITCQPNTFSPSGTMQVISMNHCNPVYFNLELIRNIETAGCTCDLNEITILDNSKLL